jgi:RNA polymerase sigma-70 factor (ECF subfamily)
VDRQRIVIWVATKVMPHEGEVRAWLRRYRLPADEIDDLIQEAYCKLVGLADVDQIAKPGAYFFQTVRNLLNEKFRRARIVRIDAVTEIDALYVYSEDPSPERIILARREWALVQDLIGALPERCRRVIEMRRIQGASQRETASRLGISESVVENETVRGIRLIMRALRDLGGDQVDLRSKAEHDRTRNR